jgi:peptidoglycan hydrolase CwlO-like protein
MMAENEDLRAQLKAMEDEMAKAKAMEPSEEEEEVEAKAKAEYDEEEVEAKAKARGGVRPVAKSKTSGPSARSRWNAAVDSCLAKCNGDKAKAVAMANRNNPGLRQAFLEEVNG